MSDISQLTGVLDALLGPDGCPWDQQQTLASMRSSVIEEVYELIDAIDDDEKTDILEELGDLLFIVIFLCKLAEKEKNIPLPHIVKGASEKLIRRHPHVFCDSEVTDARAVVDQWERIKAEEKKQRKGILDGIPRGLPILARTQEVVTRSQKIAYEPFALHDVVPFTGEDELGATLLDIVLRAEASGYDAAAVLRRILTRHEKSIKEEERLK